MTGGKGPRVTPELGPAERYRELLVLGSGGAATVSVALAQGIGGFRKLVVLKTIRGNGGGVDAEEARSFLDEARVSARLNHPNVIQVFEVFERDGLPVIVMEYLEGVSFATLMKRAAERSRPPPLEASLTLVTKALEGLHYVHFSRDFSGAPLHLVHRDVSPANLMVTYDGHVKLVDFGISRTAGGGSQTHSGSLRGKLRYMAPEQLSGELDRRVDVFAMGVILWEMLAFQRFWGSLTDAEVLLRLTRGDLPRLTDVRPEVHPELVRICSRALAPNRADRYLTADRMREDLQRYLMARRGLAPESVLGHVTRSLCADRHVRERELIQQRLESMVQSSPAGDLGSIPVGLISAHGASAGRSSLPAWTAALGLAAALSLGFSQLAGSTFVGERAQDANSAPAGARAPESVEGALEVDEPVERLQRSSRESELDEPANPRQAMAETRVDVDISARPAHARLFLDDEPLASNPFRAALRRDGQPHVLRVEADGFRPWTQTIELTADINSRVVLVPRAAPRPRRRAEATTPGATPVTSRRSLAHDVAAAPPSPEGVGAPTDDRAIAGQLSPGSDLRALRPRRPIDEEILE